MILGDSAVSVWIVPEDELLRNGGTIPIQGGPAVSIINPPADLLISVEAGNQLEAGTDGKLFVPVSGGGGSYQFISGATAPVAPPTNINQPARYYNTVTLFTWEWNIGTQEWISIPKVFDAVSPLAGNEDITILNNTLDNTPTFNYNGVGNYSIILANAFPANKVFVFTSTEAGAIIVVQGSRNSNNEMLILQYELSVSGGNLVSNGVDDIGLAYISLRVYP